MPPNELQRLLPRHFKIMQLCLTGLNRKDIALALGMSPEGVGLIINSPLFQDELASKRVKADAEAQELEHIGALTILENSANAAAQKHVDLLNSESDRVAQISATAILDRVMEKKVIAARGVKLDAEVVNLLQITINEISNSKIKPAAPPIERKDIQIAG